MVKRLREAIFEENKTIEKFLNNGIDVPGTRPQTHEEIGELYKNRKSMELLLEKANFKNRLLKTVAGNEKLFA